MLLLKQILRKKLITTRHIKTPQTLIANAQRLIDALSKPAIALYFPIAGEPDLLSLIESNPGHSFCMPKIKGDNMLFMPYKIGDETSFNERFSKILEPQSDLSLVPDVIFAPGLAFDINGNRLGRGMGFYDKYIALFPHIKIIGVTFQEKLLEGLRAEPHDCKMHYIITEHDIIVL